MEKVFNRFYATKSSKNKIETFKSISLFIYIHSQKIIPSKKRKNPFRRKQKVIPLIELFIPRPRFPQTGWNPLKLGERQKLTDTRRETK